MQHNLKLACSCPPVSEVYKNFNIFSLSVDFSNTQRAPFTCHYYRRTDCEEKGLCNLTNKTCTIRESCYAVWKNDSGSVSLEQKGCFYVEQNECQRPTCKFGKKLIKDPSVYMCCCKADFCNDELGVAPEGKEDNKTQTLEETSK